MTDFEILENGRGEHIVILPADHKVFQRFPDGKPAPMLHTDAFMWMCRAIGKREHGIQDVSHERPWRHRVWRINTSNAIFFHTRRQMRTFIVVWVLNVA